MTEENVSMRDYVDAMLCEAEKRNAQRFAAQQEAVQVGLASLDRRMEGMNEFRATLSDQTRTFVPRHEYENFRALALQRIAELQTRADKGEGKTAGLGHGWGILIALIGAAGTVAALVAAFNK